MSGTSARQALPTVIQRLREKYPEARYELNWETPLQLLVATILAAQSTDERINQVTPGLFAKYPDARAFAEAPLAELEEDLKPTGFYRNKARAVQNACKALVENFGGEVPRTMDELTTLPGVARKTANVVLTNAFRIPSGVIVDTHVARVSQRLGLSEQKRPEKIEQDLMRAVPRDEWVHFGPAMVLHGRYTCTSHAPRCAECLLSDVCPKRGVDAAAESVEEVVPASAGAGPGLRERLPADWQEALAGEFGKPYFKKLEEFVAAERREHTVFPPDEDLFAAFRLTPYGRVKVVLLGQDPYHDDGQAHGLAFSVRPGVKPPPSLANIFKELRDDVGCFVPDNGCLVPWAKQGVLLLNAVLTVRAHQPASHKDRGWEEFTDAVIRALGARPEPVVFLLWGAYAQKKGQLIDAGRHRVLTAPHPSPLSAKKFFGSRPFSKANQALQELGQAPIDWQLPDLTAYGAGEEEGLSTQYDGLSTQPDSAETSPSREVKKTSRRAKPSPAAGRRNGASAAPVAAPAAVAVEERPAPEPDLFSWQHAAPLGDWREVLAEEFDRPYFRRLEKFVAAERQAHTVFPPEDETFNAFALTPYDQVRVVLVGESPAAEGARAHGLAFSVRPGAGPTPALRHLFRELRGDLGCWVPSTGCLTPWARQGVLLLNTALTARAGEPAAHRGKGWEEFTDAVVRALVERPEPVVFLLCGDAAHKKVPLIDGGRHAVVTAPDPADRAFLGSRPFSAVNTALELRGRPAVYWQLFAG
jgi:uracil-DNA glycosylase